jgi:peptide/nickel transport system substrate-binding protein
MPVFSPKIGTSSLTPRDFFWRRWYKRFRLYILTGCGGLILLLALAVGWWIWQGQYIPADGGEVSEGLVGQPIRLNPLFSADNPVDAELAPLLFRSLLRYDDHQTLVGDLVSTWQRSDDGKVYSLSLGNNSWQDGQPITAEDVAFTIGLTQNTNYHGSWSKSFTNVTVKVLDSRHLDLTLKDSFAPFGQSLTMGILPKHILDGKSIDQLQKDPFNLQPIGSGALQFQSLTLNPQSKQLVELRFKPVGGHLDSLSFHFYNSVEAMVTDFKLGKIQMVGGSYDPTYESLSSFPDKQQKNVQLKGQSYGLFFNLHSQSVSDPAVRQALAYDVHKTQLISDVFHNQVTSLSGAYQPDSWVYSERAERYDYNQGKAKEVWDTVASKPRTVRLLVPDKPLYQQLGAALGQEWQQLGISVSVITRSPSDMGMTVNAHKDFDVVLLGEQSEVDPDRYTTWHSTQTPPTGLNITGENNQRVDKALEDGRKDLKTDDRVHDYDLFQFNVAKDAPVIWLYQPKYVNIWSNKVKGVSIGDLWEPQDRFASIKNWYVKIQRRK